jgi:hypothetical protein
MNARPLGALLASSAATAVYRHTEQPVWRGSIDVDDAKAKVGRPFGDGSLHQSLTVIDAIVETADLWANKIKEAGKQHRLSQNALKTMRVIMRKFMDFASGACEPSLDMIMTATGFSRITVIRHLKALRELRWFDWVRRTEKTGNSPKDGPLVKQATNAYFFEISRLPFDAQVHLRQILKRRGVTLNAHRDRRGSGPVPNRVQRIAQKIAKGFRAATGIGGRPAQHLVEEAEFARQETAMLGDIPTSQWASLRHPGDDQAQRVYNRRLGIHHVQSASIICSPESPPTEPE